MTDTTYALCDAEDAFLDVFADSDDQAMEACERYIASHPEARTVFLRFARSSDGQVGWINPGAGAAFHAQNWVERYIDEDR